MKNKIHVVCQRDVKDCGPCSLQSIIKYYGGYVSLEKIREDAYTSSEGTTVYHLVNVAEKYGFDALAKRYNHTYISKIVLPAIVHVHYTNGLNHFMCLYELNDKNVILMDPAKGKIKMPISDFFDIFTGVVIELSPKSKIVYLEKESNIYSLFINVFKSNKKLVFNLLLCSIILTIFTIISGFYFKVCYNLIENNAYINSFIYILFLFLIIIILKVVFEYYKMYYENHLNKNIDVNIISNFINHIFRLPLKVMNNRSSGEIMTRVNELTSIKELFSDIFVTVFLDMILALGAITILYYINIKLALILCLIMFIYIIISIFYNPYLYKRINQNIDFQTTFNTKLMEKLNMINSLKNLNNMKYAEYNNEKNLSKVIYDTYDFTTVLNFFNTIRNSLFEIGIFIINSYAFYLIYNNTLTIIDLFLFNSIMMYFIDPIKNMVTLFPKFNFLRASFRKICDFIDIKEEKLGINEAFINGDIEFKNIFFSYNGYHNNILNLSLYIKNGEKVFLKGKSGCGKSTICSLLNRSYIPDKGEILINDKNILDYSLYTIRDNIIYVSQKEELYSDTIKNNISFGIEDELLFKKVCDTCLIEDIVSKKQFRYDFGIDNNVGNISGGEKQRIILARALMRHGNILILDEALSEVDLSLEKQIIQNLIKNFANKTIIYVSHKKNEYLFDRVINFEEVNHANI